MILFFTFLFVFKFFVMTLRISLFHFWLGMVIEDHWKVSLNNFIAIVPSSKHMCWNEVLYSLVNWIFVVLVLWWFVHKHKRIRWIISTLIFFLSFRIYWVSDLLHHLWFIATRWFAAKTWVTFMIVYFVKWITVTITFIIFLGKEFVFFIFLFFVFLLIL